MYNKLMLSIAQAKNLRSPQAAVWSLRLGLAFVFAYAGVSSLREPAEWIGYLPSFLYHASFATTLLKLFAVGELVLAVWLLVGRYLRCAAVLAFLLLAGITVVNVSQFVITFRDVGLALMALALLFLV
jgi:uncharacterized membrane protein YphA (DoxX/SURF4 family)